MPTATKPTSTPAALTPGSNPNKRLVFLIGGAILFLVIVFGLLIFSGDDDGPAWTKDPRFLHNQQMEVWEMK